jgi:hypothetical protein
MQAVQWVVQQCSRMSLCAAALQSLQGLPVPRGLLRVFQNDSMRIRGSACRQCSLRQPGRIPAAYGSGCASHVHP